MRILKMKLNNVKNYCNMEKKLAIKGHPTRGKEVIELLEMMGGVNVDSHKGHFPDEWKSSYYIYGDNTIQFARDEFLLKLNFVIFTLEEFLEKFPFKVGDFVNAPEYESEARICDMRWNGYEIEYMVHECVEEDDNAKWYTAEELSKWNAEFLVDNEKNGEVQRMVRGITINHLLENALNKDLKRNLAIKGHLTRNKEVIELLKMMGGKSMTPIGGIVNRSIYTTIEGVILEIPNYNINVYDFVIFTLEEFLEKFPYKVGDKVKLYYQDEEEDRYCSAIPSTIIGMRWDKSRGKVAYKMKGIKRECYKDEISYDNNNEHSAVITDINLNRADYADEVEINLGDYEIEVRDGRTFAVLKKPTYPTNYQECCQVLGLPMQNALEYINKDCNKHDYYNDLQSTLNCFVSLKICRDAYWKIAGEQMGLGKLWKPDFTNDDEERYGIYTAANKVVKDFCGVGDVNTILTFPTEEMRDIFYENFKDLIMSCKELL